MRPKPLIPTRVLVEEAAAAMVLAGVFGSGAMREKAFVRLAGDPASAARRDDCERARFWAMNWSRRLLRHSLSRQHQ